MIEVEKRRPETGSFLFDAAGRKNNVAPVARYLKNPSVPPNDCDPSPVLASSLNLGIENFQR